MCPWLVKSSQSNFNLRLPDCYWVRSYLITTVQTNIWDMLEKDLTGRPWPRLSSNIWAETRFDLTVTWSIKWLESLPKLESVQYLNFMSGTQNKVCTRKVKNFATFSASLDNLWYGLVCNFDESFTLVWMPTWKSNLELTLTKAYFVRPIYTHCVKVRKYIRSQ